MEKIKLLSGVSILVDNLQLKQVIVLKCIMVIQEQNHHIDEKEISGI
jgi:hypothetical protein